MENKIKLNGRVKIKLNGRVIEDEGNIYYIFVGSRNFPLDNFYECKNGVEFEGIIYSNSEAAFQSAKVIGRSERIKFSTMSASQSKMSASQSKMIGKNPRLTKLRPDWNEVKDKVMYDIVKNKMERNPKILELLLSTGNKNIEEGNTWCDEYWGVDLSTRKGRNQLGKTLMDLRNYFRVKI